MPKELQNLADRYKREPEELHGAGCSGCKTKSVRVAGSETSNWLTGFIDTGALSPRKKKKKKKPGQGDGANMLLR